MFSFDDMCSKYDLMKNHLPKTMDAIKLKVDKKGKLDLYLIEFKDFSIAGNESTYKLFEVLYRKLEKKNKKTLDYYSDKKIISDKFLSQFENLKNHFIDNIEFDLRMKPIETIFVALPWLYEQYCEEKGKDKKNIREFLDNTDIHLIVFINRYAPQKNISADRLSAHSIDNALKEQYNRLHLAGIIVNDDERIMSKDKFAYFIKKENLIEN